MVFLPWTIIMHKSALGCTREERAKQVVEREATIWEYTSYVPISGAAAKLQTRKEQGVEIKFLSSHKKTEDVQIDKDIRKYNFPQGKVLFCQGDEGYSDIIERVIPDVLVEDDCESIGGENEMICQHIELEVRTRIKSIVIKEFGGIDHLPDKMFNLLKY